MGSVLTSAPLPTETTGAPSGLSSSLRAALGVAAGLPCCVRRPVPALRLGLVLLLAGACASAPARTALQGDLPALKAAIEQAEQRDALSASGLRELAGAVLRRELSAVDEPSAGVTADAFPDVRACAPEIRSVLEDVATGANEYSTAAAMALLDAGYSAPGARGPTSQAVEAREAVGPRAGERRRASLLNGDAAVRRAALGAALEGASEAGPADIAALAEAARLDPDPEARALAIRALGRVGSAEAVVALIDVNASAGLDERREIIRAWALPSSYVAGGGEQLEALARGSGDTSVQAALALVGHGESAALASATLVRAIEGNRSEEQLDALAAAPWSDLAVREAIGAARKHSDASIRVLALFRFVEAGAADASVGQELAQLATDSVTPVGAVARAALARLGKADVKAALRADLAARAADRRTLAALALLELKDWPGAARALGDDSPGVRRTVACQVLAEPVASGDPPVERPAIIAGAPPVVPLLLTEPAG